MLGFLFKVLLVAAIVVGVVGYIGLKRGQLPQLPTDWGQILSQLPVDTNVLGQLKRVRPNQVGTQVSAALDALVTHPDRNSPVVLGVKVTNESIGTITDLLMGLPPDKLEQVKSVVCTPQ